MQHAQESRGDVIQNTVFSQAAVFPGHKQVLASEAQGECNIQYPPVYATMNGFVQQKLETQQDDAFVHDAHVIRRNDLSTSMNKMNVVSCVHHQQQITAELASPNMFASPSHDAQTPATHNTSLTTITTSITNSTLKHEPLEHLLHDALNRSNTKTPPSSLDQLTSVETNGTMEASTTISPTKQATLQRRQDIYDHHHEFHSPLKKRKTVRVYYADKCVEMQQVVVSSNQSSPIDNSKKDIEDKEEELDRRFRARQTKTMSDHYYPSDEDNSDAFDPEDVEDEEDANYYDSRSKRKKSSLRASFIEQEDELEPEDEMEDDFDSENEEDKKRKKKLNKLHGKTQAKQKTTGGKVYDSVKGTTCHQCKQKTADIKTNCSKCTKNSGSTIRGAFCSSCLRNRYGEVIEDAVNNMSWVCPVCRGVCNCSSCRRKLGKFPISITTREALKKGYVSVFHMLVAKGVEKEMPLEE